MRRKTVLAAALLLLAGILSMILCGEERTGALFSLAVTLLTTAWHFWMRLLVGFAFDRLMHNRADYRKPWFQCRDWELRLYKRLRVKRWKKKMPTFAPEYFDPRKHSWEEIAGAMCQAELVHEVIAVLSFIPVLFSLWAGALPVFVITSVFAAAFDLVFVVMQRYNRQRVVRLIR